MKFDKAQILHKECYVDNIWYYHKSNLIRAPLEGLITIYLAELALMFSAWFVDRPQFESNHIVLIVLFPLLFALIVCLAYSAVVVYFINKAVFKLAKIIQAHKPGKNKSTLYLEIDDEAAKTFRWIHTLGSVCYLVVSYLVANFVLNWIFRAYNPHNMFILLSFGFFMGVLWNIYGYFSDRRIDWCKIFKIFDKQNVSLGQEEVLQKRKYRYYQRSIKWQIIIIVAITAVLGLILFTLDYASIARIAFNDLITYSVFAAWFVTILKVYGIYMFNLFFARKENGSEIFPLISDIFKPPTEKCELRE